jgi:hypothetical protein
MYMILTDRQAVDPLHSMTGVMVGLKGHFQTLNGI